MLQGATRRIVRSPISDQVNPPSSGRKLMSRARWTVHVFILKETMNRTFTPQIRDLALRLLAFEAGAGIPSGRAAARVSEKLGRPLSTLVGGAGYRSLLSRALALGSTERGWLKAVQVNASGALEGFDEAEAQVSKVEATEGGAIIITNLLGLLVTFTGEAFTLGVVQDAWPKEAFDDFDDMGKNI